MDLKLVNRRVLITGSSQGLGYGIAEGFLRESAKVIITGRSEERLNDAYKKLSETYGVNNLYFLKTDFTNRESVKKTYSFILDKLGGLDILVNNVGTGSSVPDAIPSEKDWSFSWNQNFEASIIATRIFFPLLKVGVNSSILFISSIAAKEAFGAPVAYSTAKTAINAFAKNISRKVAGNVRVNVLAPGNVFFEGGSWDKKIKANKKDVLNLIKNTVPMNRFASLEEIANAALFLSSDVSSFTTGAVLVVDGGQTITIP